MSAAGSIDSTLPPAVAVQPTRVTRNFTGRLPITAAETSEVRLDVGVSLTALLLGFLHNFEKNIYSTFLKPEHLQLEVFCC